MDNHETTTGETSDFDALFARVEGVVTADACDAAALDAETGLPEGVQVVRRMGGEWKETGVEGVRVKILHEDATADERTALYQMDPGAAYPAHVHGGTEECYVLDGDLQVGELPMERGDYQRVGGGSHHVVQSTTGGCVLFIRCSMSDELLEQ